MDNNTSSRRAFPLDSRAVWVEQQITRGCIVSRDNLILGPGEYNPSSPERHISTPSIGATRHLVDFIQPFRNDLKLKNPSGIGSPNRIKSASNNNNMRDFTTIFHNNDSRQGLDPNQSFCPIPIHTYLGPSNTLKIVKNDGVLETKSLSFGDQNVPFGSRMIIKTALPDYDPKYDSLQLRPTTKLGSFNKAKRIEIPQMNNHIQNEDKDKNTNLDNNNNSSNLFGNNSANYLSLSPNSKSNKFNQSIDISSIGYTTKQQQKQQQQQQQQQPIPMSVYQYRCSLVALPKLKKRTPPVLTYDDSSYQTDITKQPLTLTPNITKKKAKVQLYDKYLAIPRKHHSTDLPIKITKPLW